MVYSRNVMSDLFMCVAHGSHSSLHDCVNSVHGRDDIYSDMTGGGRVGGRCQDLQRVHILSLSLYLPGSTFLWIR